MSNGDGIWGLASNNKERQRKGDRNIFPFYGKKSQQRRQPVKNSVMTSKNITTSKRKMPKKQITYVSYSPEQLVEEPSNDEVLIGLLMKNHDGLTRLSELKKQYHDLISERNSKILDPIFRFRPNWTQNSFY